MKIEVGKTYLTRDDRKVRILCTDYINCYSIVGIINKGKNKHETLVVYTECGNRYIDDVSESDLVAEYSIWDDVEVDTHIFVKTFEEQNWKPRHFAKFEGGNVFAWVQGTTSFSTDCNPIKIKYAKLAEEKE